MVLLEEVVAVLTRNETGGLPGMAGEAGNAEAGEGEIKGSDRRVGSQKLDSLCVTSAMELMAASTLASKSRKAGRLTSSSETPARKPTRAEMNWRMMGRADQLGRRRTAARERKRERERS